ncbi:phytanoyl-CoA dioxygenase family protein [uncultured Roseobacter sp.]|uniref:phytanoyl-CoA dioxygenase family protein n=1 Tax=uncultured Roseobacter sp. TaxID=114847 RepID=UPI002606F233|nr:phytanoyl-CoA dioxygenase family protein [uncultured Roseobacter sp.]
MLTTDQINSFRTDGYLVVPDVVPAVTLEAVREEYAKLMDRLYQGWFEAGKVEKPGCGMTFWDKLQTAYDAGLDWFQPMDISLPGDTITENTPMHFGPGVFDLLRCEDILDIVQALIGPEITSNPIQHVRIKPPAKTLKGDEVRAHITATDWHQDRGVGLEEADGTDMITVWIAMTDATPENGCLQVIPGQHREMLPHCPKTQTAIADGFVDAAQAVPLPVGAGGIVLFHPLTPHSSRVNVTNGFRWSFDIRYNVTGQPTGRAHFPDFVARSHAAPETMLTDWRRWQIMWEDARTRLATQQHIPIHRWQSDAPFCA